MPLYWRDKRLSEIYTVTTGKESDVTALEEAATLAYEASAAVEFSSVGEIISEIVSSIEVGDAKSISAVSTKFSD